MISRLKRMVLAFAILALIAPPVMTGGTSIAQAAEGQVEGGNLDFFSNAKMGLFVHYTYSYPGYEYGHTYDSPGGNPVADVNALADGFDEERFADVAQSMGAEYVTFTVFHAGMSALYPSETMNAIMPGKASNRDVIGDLLAALTARNIKLVLYFHPVDGHDLTTEQQALTGWGNYELWNKFINDLIVEIGERYDGQIAGFWFDGAPGSDRIDGARLKASVRQYNPEAAVWVNYGIRYNDSLVFPHLSDFVASETMGGIDANTDNWLTSSGQENNRVTQEWWARYNTPILYNAESMLRYTVRLAATLGQRNGGIQWATGPYANNEWEPGVEAEFARLGEKIAEIGPSLFGTRPSTSYITYPHTTQNDTWGVATDSADGQYVYLHVLNAPVGQTLQIDRAFDGREFHEARLLKGDVPLSLVQNAGGYAITLLEGETWNETITVIRLGVSKSSDSEQWKQIEHVRSIGIAEMAPTSAPKQFKPVYRGYMADGQSIVLDNRFVKLSVEPSSAITAAPDGTLTGVKPGVTSMTLSLDQAVVSALVPGISVPQLAEEYHLIFNGRAFEWIPVDFRDSGAFFTKADVTTGPNNELFNHVTVPQGLGFAFRTGANPITVSQLGRYYTAGSNRIHTLFIYDHAMNKVAETDIDMAKGRPDEAGFKYSPLPEAVVLQPNQDYYMTSSEEAGGDYFHNSGVALTYDSSQGTVLGPYHAGDRMLTGSGARSYGPVNFKMAEINLGDRVALSVENMQLSSTEVGYVEVHGLRADEQREIVSNRMLTFLVEDPSVAVVRNNGTVRPLKPGTTMVTVSAAERPELTAQFRITVTDGEAGVELGALDGNLALSASVTTSSTVEAEVWAKSFAVDGLRGLNGQPPFGWTSADQLGVDHTEWIKLDLGRIVPMNRIDLYPRNDADREGYGFPIDFTVQVSNDDAHWETVVSETDYALPAPGEVQSFALDGIAAARFVKIVGTKLRSAPFDADQYRMQLAEIEIFAPSATEVAAGIRSLTTPTAQDTLLKLPGVPKGYGIEIASSSREEVIALDGRIAIPEADAAVELVLKVTRNSDQQTGLTLPIIVTVAGSATNGPPEAPAIVTAAAAGTSAINLNWAESVGATGYRIYRAVAADGEYGFVGTSATDKYADTGLASGKSYFYRISAVNDHGESGLSHAISATTSSSGGTGGSGNTGGSYGGPVGSPGQTSTEVKGSTIKPDSVLAASSGNSVSTVDQESIEQAWANAMASGAGAISIEVPHKAGAASYVVSLPKTALDRKEGAHRIHVLSAAGDLNVPVTLLGTMNTSGKQTVSLQIGSADKSAWSEAVRNAVGDRPAIDLSVRLDDSAVAWRNSNTPIRVSIPYVPTAEERLNPEHIIVWFVDEAGNVSPVPSGKYDAATGRVTFNAVQAGKYAVTYVEKSFADLDRYPWARKQIEAMSARGIINGRTEATFDPGASISRAEFMKLLVTALELHAVANQPFDDVSSAKYYYNEVGIARTLGIAGGIGGNRFEPDADITRQDMIVLAEKAMRIVNKQLAVGRASDLRQYADSAQIAAYAADSIAALTAAGIVTGSDGAVKPQASSTRAEAAVLIYKIMSSLYGSKAM